MSQFVCIIGASVKETRWYSKACNAFGEQIGHILKDAETAALCCVKGLNRVSNPRFSLFLAYYCGYQRHYDPDCEFMTFNTKDIQE